MIVLSALLVVSGFFGTAELSARAKVSPFRQNKAESATEKSLGITANYELHLNRSSGKLTQGKNGDPIDAAPGFDYAVSRSHELGHYDILTLKGFHFTTTANYALYIDFDLYDFFIVIEDGTTNSLTVRGSQQTGLIYTRGDCTFSGKGTLNLVNESTPELYATAYGLNIGRESTFTEGCRINVTFDLKNDLKNKYRVPYNCNLLTTIEKDCILTATYLNCTDIENTRYVSAFHIGKLVMYNAYITGATTDRPVAPNNDLRILYPKANGIPVTIDTTHDFGENAETPTIDTIDAFDAGGHWQSCKKSNHGCNVKRFFARHTSDSFATPNAPETCNVCNYEVAAAHTFTPSSTWTHDETGHWHNCTFSGCGEKSDFAQHTPDRDFATATEAVTCEICTQVLVAAHNFTCETTDWTHDETGHWRTCTFSGCGETKEKLDHTPGEAANFDRNQECTVCGYEIEAKHIPSSDWTHDETGHWHVCATAGCSEVTQKVAHTPGAAANFDRNQECTVCGYEIEAKHIPSSDWKSDASGHWHGCATADCGDVTQKVAHTPGAAATLTADQTCTECSYIIVHKIQGNPNSPVITLPDKPVTVRPDGGKGLDFTSDRSGEYTLVIVEFGAAAPTTVPGGKWNALPAGQNSVILPDLGTTDKDIYLFVRDADGNVSMTKISACNVKAPVSDGAKIVYTIFWILDAVLVLAIAVFVFLIIKRKNKDDKNNGMNAIMCAPMILSGAGAVASSVIAIILFAALCVVLAAVALHYFGILSKLFGGKIDRLVVKALGGKNKADSHTANADGNCDAMPDGADKSVEEWLEEETLNLEEAVENGQTPHEYLQQSLAEAQEKNRIDALNLLMQGLSEREAEERRRKAEREAQAAQAVEKDLQERKTDETDETTLRHSAEEKSKQNEKARSEFVAAKKSGLDAPIPPLTFTLSREDIFDFVEKTTGQKEFPIQIQITKRAKRHLPDTLYCGKWCFAIMREKADVIKLTLRGENSLLNELQEKYTAVEKAAFPKGNWFNVIVDSSFAGKSEVYALLANSYKAVLCKNYKQTAGDFSTDITAAENDVMQIKAEVAESLRLPDPIFDGAIAERSEAMETYKKQNESEVAALTRERISAYVSRAFEGCKVVENARWYMPVTLKRNQKTFAMVYEKNNEVSLTLRISDEYAESLGALHPLLRRARFPRGANWYSIPVDGSFKTVQEVYSLLKDAEIFITK